MGKASREKGARAELEVSHILQEYGFDGKRTAQHSGKNGGAADVVGLPGFHLEVKRCERLELPAWIAQAERDAAPDEIPCVVFRRSKEQWRVEIPLKSLLQLVEFALLGGWTSNRASEDKKPVQGA